MKIVFLRHGESMGNVWSGAYADDATNFLSLRGCKQAELSAYTIHDWMPKIDKVLTSELTRARQTATTVMQTMGNWKRSYQPDARLNEWCWTATPGPEWFLVESSPDFWSRIIDFFDDSIRPNMNTKTTMMVVSHYYTMFALFEIIKQELGVDHNVGSALNIHEHSGIPNAIPWFFDTEDNTPPRIILPGHNDVNR